MSEREKSILLFALRFLRANLEDIEADGLLEEFGELTDDEIDELMCKL